MWRYNARLFSHRAAVLADLLTRKWGVEGKTPQASRRATVVDQRHLLRDRKELAILEARNGRLALPPAVLNRRGKTLAVHVSEFFLEPAKGAPPPEPLKAAGGQRFSRE
jgi:hypothetical protein